MLTRAAVLCSSLYEETFHATLKLVILNELNAGTLCWGKENCGLIRLITQGQELGFRLFCSEHLKRLIPQYRSGSFSQSTLKKWKFL